MYKNPKKVCFVTLYLEESLFKVEEEPRITFVRQNRNKKGILKELPVSVFLQTIYFSKCSFYLQSVGSICFPQKLPFFLLLRLTQACFLEC